MGTCAFTGGAAGELPGRCEQPAAKAIREVSPPPISVWLFLFADEADPTVRPLQPHQVAGLHRLRILPDRDHLAAIEPGGGEPHRALRATTVISATSSTTRGWSWRQTPAPPGEGTAHG